MALPLFEPWEPPVIGGFTDKAKRSVRETKLGNNYSQRVKFGLNSTQRTLSVSWEDVPLIHSNYFMSFFKAIDGLAFNWKPPFDDVVGQWTCDDWERNFANPIHSTFNATFVESFGIY